MVSVFDEDLCCRTVFAHNWARSHHVGLTRVIWQPELAAAAEATAMAQGTDDVPQVTYNWTDSLECRMPRNDDHFYF